MARESNLRPWPIHLFDGDGSFCNCVVVMVPPRVDRDARCCCCLAAWRLRMEAAPPRRAEAILPSMILGNDCQINSIVMDFLAVNDKLNFRAGLFSVALKVCK